MSYSAFIKELKKALTDKPSFPQEAFFLKSSDSCPKFCICLPNSGAPIVPRVALDYFYDEYENGRSIDNIADSIIEIYISHFNRNSDFQKPTVWDSVKNRIVYQLINFEDNKSKLLNCPYINIGDMALIFKSNAGELGIDGFFTVTYDIYRMLGVSIYEMIKQAEKNTPEILPMRIIKIDDMLPDLNTEEALKSLGSEDAEFRVVGNIFRQNGAAAVLYDEFCTDIRKNGFNDACIIPLSVHEVIAVYFNGSLNEKKLQNMLEQSNASLSGHKREHLSNKVILYSELVNSYHKVLETLYTSV